MKLLEILSDNSPSIQGNGQIVMQCAFPENHSVDSQKRKQMYLSPNINVYHCFSCGAKGRLTQLLSTRFDVPYYEALEMVHIDTYERKKRDDLSDVDYYWEYTAPEEFVSRGFTPEFLRTKRVGIGEKGEIVVPMLWDGKLKGLKYRVQVPKRKFWYSELFNKENYLYNGDKRYKDYVILVEGETDCWTLEQWGFQVYGTLGTGLSDWQVEHIVKTKKVYIASDTDVAGVKAGNSWYEKLNRYTDVMFINYPAKDPGECTYRQFKYAFNNPVDYLEFKLLTGI